MVVHNSLYRSVWLSDCVSLDTKVMKQTQRRIEKIRQQQRENVRREAYGGKERPCRHVTKDDLVG